MWNSSIKSERKRWREKNTHFYLDQLVINFRNKFLPLVQLIN